MLKYTEILNANQSNYDDLYSKQEAFLRYPADWVIRFHNMYLKENIPSGRVLDYGCGSGNNSMFFIEKGYETYGTEVNESALSLINLNLESKHLDSDLARRFQIILPDSTSLPFKDNYFDFILSNQVLYYLPSEEHIKKVCMELHRCLRPGGAVFFTMVGPKNNYITHHSKQIHHGKIHEVLIADKSHRLYNVHELIYVVNDENELKQLFSNYECVSTGYFDESMLDLTSNFHWIFIGKKK